jgi:hypothetical protein
LADAQPVAVVATINCGAVDVVKGSLSDALGGGTSTSVS